MKAVVGNLKTAVRIFPVVVVILTLALGAWGVRGALYSPLFTVKVVEVIEEPKEESKEGSKDGVKATHDTREARDARESDDTPALTQALESQVILDLADVPVNKTNLFALKLAPIEKRILTHPWVREVSLTKKFPQTLSIAVKFREPAAVLQRADGNLAYVDRNGEIFSRWRSDFVADLPIIRGFGKTGQPDVRQAIKLITTWEESTLKDLTDLSMVSWEPTRGYRAWMSYALGPDKVQRSRAIVDLGHDAATLASTLPLDRLGHVIGYVQARSIPVRQFFADIPAVESRESGASHESVKKIVVRIARGS